MRKLITIVFAVIIVLFAFGDAGQAQPTPNCSQACTNLGDLGLSHGQCVSLCQTCNCLDTNGETCPVCECKIFDLVGISTVPLGDCVSFMRQNGIRRDHGR